MSFIYHRFSFPSSNLHSSSHSHTLLYLLSIHHSVGALKNEDCKAAPFLMLCVFMYVIENSVKFYRIVMTF